jgi:CDP-diacylglycerol--glycerol-3-phosphate 3-phosphatidyltransferase/cardiolipin synthase
MDRIAPTPRALVLALPNVLTYLRIAVVPILVACVFAGGTPLRWLAFGLFILASVTDWLDGYLARRWAQQSTLGRMLDPIADKLLVGTTLLMLVYDGTIGGWSIWAAAIVLCREILVSGLREFLAELNVRVHVTELAKWKTAVQMLALAVLLVGPAVTGWSFMMNNIGINLLWIAAALTLVTGYDYLMAGIRHATER